MANRAGSRRSAPPKCLIPSDLRSEIYCSTYWREHCVDLTITSLIYKARDLDYVSGYMSPFMCLLLRMLLMAPNQTIVTEIMEESSGEHGSYSSALSALYLRLTAADVDVYRHLESLYEDYRLLAVETEEGIKAFTSKNIDEFVKELLIEDHFFRIQLPVIRERRILEALHILEPRRSPLREEESAEDCRPTDALDTVFRDKLVSTTIGITTKEGIVLATEKLEIIPLQSGPLVPGRIMLLDEHVACSFSFLSTDASKLLKRAQIETLNHRFFDEAMTVESISRDFCDLVQELHQDTSETFVVSFLIAGHDENGPSLTIAAISIGSYGVVHVQISGDFYSNKKCMKDFLSVKLLYSIGLNAACNTYEHREWLYVHFKSRASVYLEKDR